jgi:hypothetical protein
MNKDVGSIEATVIALLEKMSEADVILITTAWPKG